MSKTPVVAAPILLFLLFLNIEVNNNKIRLLVLTVSSSVFGVYLIHMNRHLKVPLLDVHFDNVLTYGSWKLPAQIIFGTALIFMSCIIFDVIRSKTIEEVIEKLVICIADKIDKLVSLIECR